MSSSVLLRVNKNQHMTYKDLQDPAKQNALVNHPLQTFEWGTFREKTGIKVIRRGGYEGSKLVDAYQLTLHRIPHTPFSVGYLPKGNPPTKAMLQDLTEIGKRESCLFIQLEPNIVREKDNKEEQLFTALYKSTPSLVSSAHPLFTKYTFFLDLRPSEEELLQHMHSKTRYNIRLAQKRGVVIKEEQSDSAFKQYLSLMEETTNRQGFYAHTKKYHEMQWEVLHKQTKEKNAFQSHLFLAYYTPEQKKERVPLVGWILFRFKDTLYYPYGASSNLHREVMASNLMMWEAIKFGKAQGCKLFDMWGALGPEPDTNDPWYGFHRFKQGYGTELVSFVGSYDLVINKPLYALYKIADKIRWFLLQLKK